MSVEKGWFIIFVEKYYNIFFQCRAGRKIKRRQFRWILVD
jgi:hypothetical protein